ncbi:pLS20_p028 family conjugation system transmembrane protein [Enterococcus cecorum]|uniref:pLS20_p028 family conjugation system transmembrane protein n=1 Tax=Enterococcus cecorum TaxID=44008 RepID=UPI003B438351
MFKKAAEGEKGANKYIYVSLFILVAIIFMMSFYEKDVFASFFKEDTQKQTEFLTNPELRPYLRKFDGGIVQLIFVQLGWLLIKGAYFLATAIQGLTSDFLTLFNFVKSTGMNQVYQSVLNTVVVGLMILSLIFIGYKMVIGKGTVDLKSVGMNVVISVCLILLMPTMITSGIKFAEIFYKDSVSISGGNGDIAWSLMKNNITDLAYVNQTKGAYNKIASLNQRNNLSKDNLMLTNLGQVLTSDYIDAMQKQNPEASNFRYDLVPDPNGNLVATKFDDGFFSIFSDSLKTGYYRYPTNMWGLLIAMISLAVAYSFSFFIIVTSVIELAFKRIVGVVVFATDLETGQRSKMVLSDILQCYLTIGFQGFGLGMFGLFISYMNTISINPIVKTVAFIASVIVLIKGSGTIMRYFGVDIGLKEGYGQLASAFGLGSLVARKGTSFGRTKMAKRSDTQDSDNQDNRQAEKNFGESLATKAKYTGNKFGYARERGLSGLASDGLSKVGEKATKPFKDMRNVARGGLDGFKDGLTDGTATAIEKNSRAKASTAQDNGRYDTSMPTRLSNRQDGAKIESADRVISSSERMRALENGGNMSAVQQKVQQDVEQRRNALHNTGTSSAEEIINQKRNEAKYTPEAMTRDEMVRQRTQGLTGANTSNREVSVRENVQGATGTTNRTVDVRENLQGSTSSQPRTIDVRENVQGATGTTNRTVDVRENLQGSTSSQSRTVDVRENVQGATGTTNRTVDVRENLQGSTSSQPRTIDVRENVQGATGITNRTVDVRENLQGSTSSQPRTIDVRENVQGATGTTNRTVDVRENLQGSTSSQPRTIDVRENVQGATGTTNRTVDVRENLQGSTSSQPRTIDVRENVQGATGTTNRTVDVRENLQGSTSSQPRTIDVRENVQGATGATNRTVDVRENIQTQHNQANIEDKTQKINIVENRQEAKKVDKETVIVNKEVKEVKRKRFTYEDNDLFRDRSNDYNPLFDFSKKEI